MKPFWCGVCLKAILRVSEFCQKKALFGYIFMMVSSFRDGLNQIEDEKGNDRNLNILIG